MKLILTINVFAALNFGLAVAAKSAPTSLNHLHNHIICRMMLQNVTALKVINAFNNYLLTSLLGLSEVFTVKYQTEALMY